MKARDVMSRPAIFVRTRVPVDVAAALLVAHGFTAAPVLDDDDRLVGLVTETDLVGGPPEPDDGLPEELPQPTVGEVMTEAVVTARPDDELVDVVAAMLDASARSVPVVDDGRLVGVLTGRDVLRLVAHGTLAPGDVWRPRADGPGTVRRPG